MNVVYLYVAKRVATFVCRLVGHKPIRLGNSEWFKQKCQDVGCVRCGAVFFGPRGEPLKNYRWLP